MTLDAIIPRAIARFRPIPSWIKDLEDESDRLKLKLLLRSGRKLDRPDGIKFFISNIKTLRDAKAIGDQVMFQGWGGRVISEPKTRPIKMEIYHPLIHLDEEAFAGVNDYVSRIATMYGANSDGWDSKFVRQPFEYWDIERLTSFYDVTCAECKRTHVGAYYAVTMGEHVITVIRILYYCHDSSSTEDVFVEMCFGDLSSDNEKAWKKNVTITCHMHPSVSNYHERFAIMRPPKGVRLDKIFGKRLTIEQAAASPHYATVWQVLEYIGTTGHYRYLQQKAREM